MKAASTGRMPRRKVLLKLRDRVAGLANDVDA
jgi:hypothetical protein